VKVFHFLPDEGTFFFSVVRCNLQSHPYVQMALRALASGITMQITRPKSPARKTFKCFQSGTPESRLLNNALAVCCLLNQRSQIAQIVIHAMPMTFCFLGGLVENAAENIQGKKQFAKSRMLQVEEGKHVYFIYTFVAVTFKNEVKLVCKWRIQ